MNLLVTGQTRLKHTIIMSSQSNRLEHCGEQEESSSLVTTVVRRKKKKKQGEPSRIVTVVLRVSYLVSVLSPVNH